jgi:hypothetical protein
MAEKEKQFLEMMAEDMKGLTPEQRAFIQGAARGMSIANQAKNEPSPDEKQSA